MPPTPTTPTFTVRRDVLSRELSLLATIANKPNVIPVLSTVLLVVAEDMLTLTVSDLDVSLIVELPCISDILWGGCVPCGQLASLVKLLDTDDVVFKVRDTRLQVGTGKSKHLLPLTPARDYPEVEHATGEVALTVEGEALRGALTRILPCVSTDPSRYTWQCVKLEGGDGKLTAVALDGSRLGVVVVEASGTVDTLIPAKGLRLLLKLPATTLTLHYDTNHATWEADGRVCSMRLATGDYPNWKSIIPVDAPLAMTVDRGSLLAALNRVGLTRDETFKIGVGKLLGGVKVTFARDVLSIETTANVKGRSLESVAVISNMNGSTVAMGLNPDFLSDYLQRAGETVELAFTDGNKPLLLTDGNYRGVIVPRRID